MLFYLSTNIGILGYHTLCNFRSALQFLIFARNVSCLSFRTQYDPAFYPVFMIQEKLSTAVYCPVLLSNTGDTKKRELLKNPTKIEEIQKKKILTEIETLQLAF